jgi:hypothetical protein
MEKKVRRLISIGFSFFIAFILLGCAITGKKEKAFDTENLLVSAGFNYTVANTDEKLDKLNKLPQRKLLRHARQGNVTYIYADAVDCKCAYTGDEAAYQRLRHLVYSEKLTAKQEKGIWSTAFVRDVADFEDLELGDGFDPFID